MDVRAVRLESPGHAGAGISHPSEERRGEYYFGLKPTPRPRRWRLPPASFPSLTPLPSPPPQTLSSFAKARMILSVLLVKRRVVSDVTPLESFLKELNTETDEWIKVLLACSDEKRRS